MTPASNDAREMAAYEDLRREVLSGETLGTGNWGLALVSHRGVMTWLQALARREDEPPHARPQLRQIAHNPKRDDWPARSAITTLLAGMILAGRREVRA